MIFFLDTETTGLYRDEGAELVELSVLSEDGEVVCDTLLKPQKKIPISATNVHGITNEMVKDAPRLSDVWPAVYERLKDNIVVIYNARFDAEFLPDLWEHKKVWCCMERYAVNFGEWSDHHMSYKWIKLTTAAKQIGYELPENMQAHRALADCYMCRAVWNRLEELGAE